MLAFLVASLVLAITPGPGVTYIVTRSIAQGRAAGLASVLGVALGNLGNGIGAAVGLAILFARIPTAYDVVRIAGALYLALLGVLALRAPAMKKDATTLASSSLAIVRDGFFVALLNPKTALFFAAFLPQFVATPSALEAALYAASFVAIAAVTDAGYALAASRIAPMLKSDRAAAVMRWAPACVYFALAILALSSGGA